MDEGSIVLTGGHNLRSLSKFISLHLPSTVMSTQNAFEGTSIFSESVQSIVFPRSLRFLCSYGFDTRKKLQIEISRFFLMPKIGKHWGSWLYGLCFSSSP